MPIYCFIPSLNVMSLLLHQTPGPDPGFFFFLGGGGDDAFQHHVQMWGMQSIDLGHELTEGMKKKNCLKLCNSCHFTRGYIPVTSWCFAIQVLVENLYQISKYCNFSIQEIIEIENRQTQIHKKVPLTLSCRYVQCVRSQDGSDIGATYVVVFHACWNISFVRLGIRSAGFDLPARFDRVSSDLVWYVWVKD